MSEVALIGIDLPKRVFQRRSVTTPAATVRSHGNPRIFDGVSPYNPGDCIQFHGRCYAADAREPPPLRFSKLSTTDPTYACSGAKTASTRLRREV